METPAADTGPVTRSRKSMLLEYAEKENSCSTPGTPTRKNNRANDFILKEAELIVHKLNSDVGSSPIKSLRSGRSISLCSNPDSPSKNLRKRNLSPDLTNNSCKSKTPPDRLQKNSLDSTGSTAIKKDKKLENGIFSTVDSPKPRKIRSSISDSSAPALDTPTLRRSRRLSTELNIVQEDPIREAEVDTPTLLPSNKTRRGKRLSVVPSQPSLPEAEENETLVVNVCKEIEEKSSIDSNKSQNSSLTSVSPPVNTCAQNVDTDGPEKNTEVAINSEDSCQDVNEKNDAENITLKLNGSSNNRDSLSKSLTDKCSIEMLESNSSSNEINKDLSLSDEIDCSNNSNKNIFESKFNDSNDSNNKTDSDANNASNINVSNVSLKKKKDDSALIIDVQMNETMKMEESLNNTIVDKINGSHKENSFNKMNLSKNSSSRVSAKDIFIEEMMDQSEPDITIEIKKGLEEENTLISCEDNKLNISLPRKKSDVITSTPLVLNNLNNEKTSKINNKSSDDASNLPNTLHSSSEDEDVTLTSEDEDSVDFKLTLIDDAASDAGSGYKSGDSMSKSEREDIEKNEIHEKGESLNSDTSSISSNDTYEKDSFICTTDEEDEQLLDGTEDDLSSADELTQSKESKAIYNDKQKKMQKKASKEMFEAKHSGYQEKLVIDVDSSLDRSLNSSIEHDYNEKEITAANLTSIGSDPLLLNDNKDDNSNSSADSEGLTAIHKMFDDELKKLQNNTIVKHDSDSATDDEKTMTEEKSTKIFNNEKSNANSSVPEISDEAKVVKKSRMNKKDCKDIANKSDVVYANNSEKMKSNNRSLNLSSHSEMSSQRSSKMLSILESKERLINLNNSLSKMYKSLEKRSEELTAIKVSLENKAEEAITGNTDAVEHKLAKSQKRKMDVIGNEVPMKKMKLTESIESNDIKMLYDETEYDSIQKVTKDLKKKKHKKLSKQKNNNLITIEDTGNTSIFGFKVKQTNPQCSKEGSSLSTTDFEVESLKCDDDIATCTDSAGMFSITEKWTKNIIPGSTTQFNVIALKSHPKKIIKVNSKVDKFVNFKTDMLYNKNIKRESSSDLLKKQQKSMNFKLYRNIATLY